MRWCAVCACVTQACSPLLHQISHTSSLLAGIAYISNVAVSPELRRCGVAVRLMAEAEALAAGWGCSRAALHCNPSNQPAMQLYRRLRYKNGPLEAPWMPYLQVT
jgi:ribosomal protein S18 acetylase RimI-like enzyme